MNSNGAASTGFKALTEKDYAGLYNWRTFQPRLFLFDFMLWYPRNSSNIFR